MKQHSRPWLCCFCRAARTRNSARRVGRRSGSGPGCIPCFALAQSLPAQTRRGRGGRSGFAARGQFRRIRAGANRRRQPGDSAPRNRLRTEARAAEREEGNLGREISRAQTLRVGRWPRVVLRSRLRLFGHRFVRSAWRRRDCDPTSLQRSRALRRTRSRPLVYDLRPAGSHFRGHRRTATRHDGFQNGGNTGPRWHTDARDTRGYVARHPVGM